MADIYQEIWTADQEGSGLMPSFDRNELSSHEGYVLLNSRLGKENVPDLRVIEDISIPESKRETYNLCRRLFNNYALPERDREVDTPIERTERHEFIEAIRNTSPMQIARDYIVSQTGNPITDERWHNTRMDHWFRRFEMGSDPHLSGSEHVVAV